jgi:hypothetical protein
LRGDNFVVIYYLIASENWADKSFSNEKVASFERGYNIVVFYYLNASEIWLEKRGEFGGRNLIRGRQL